jgi:hypothetical protein
MVTVRTKRLQRMTRDFLDWDAVDATDLYGIGKYGSDSYEIFFKQNYTVQPTDKELTRYLREEIFKDQPWHDTQFHHSTKKASKNAKSGTAMVVSW